MTGEAQAAATSDGGNRGLALALRFFQLFESLGVLIMIVVVVALVVLGRT